MIDVSRLIRTTLHDSDTADPATLINEVLDQVDPGDYAEAIRQLLRNAIVVEISRLRRSQISGYPRPRSSTSNISSKRDAIRQYAGVLRERIPGAGGEWKFLADCTVSDLLAAAAQRRDFAVMAVHRAERYEKIAVLLDEYNVTTVKQLPLDLVEATA